MWRLQGLLLGLYTNMGERMGDGSPGLNCSSSECEMAQRYEKTGMLRANATSHMQVHAHVQTRTYLQQTHVEGCS